MPATSVQMVDATAAGTPLLLVTRRLLQEQPQTSSEFATLVGALTVTKPGAQDSLPSKEEVEDFAKHGRWLMERAFELTDRKQD